MILSFEFDNGKSTQNNTIKNRAGKSKKIIIKKE